MKFNFLREWRILLFLAVLIICIVLFLPISKGGVIVTSISDNSPFSGKVQIGETINWANEKQINSPEDLYGFENFTGTFRFMHSGILELVNIGKPGLGITVSKKSTTNLNLGLDVISGTKYLLEPENKTLTKNVINVLESRTDLLGLKETTIKQADSYIEIDTASSLEDVQNLLKEGKFEAKISRGVVFSNNTGSLTLGQKYPVKLNDSEIEINNVTLRMNQTSKLNGIEFEVYNITNDSALLLFTSFTGKDIKFVCIREQSGICVSRIVKAQNGWQFSFQINVTDESAERFANITNDMKIKVDSSGNSYLDGKIIFFLDDRPITELSISSDLKGKTFDSPAITGFRTDRDSAVREQLMLKSVLQSGALPTGLKIIKTEEISPLLGKNFFESSIVGLIIAVIISTVFIFLVHRNVKVLIPNVIWIFSEAFIITVIIGMIWIIDLFSIIGIIFVILKCMTDNIIIINEMLSKGKEIDTTKQRIRRISSVINYSALAIIVAVIPILFINNNALRGFVTATVIGSLISVIISKPAFARINEKLLEHH
jgi:preprotein translocase subunit SecD